MNQTVAVQVITIDSVKVWVSLEEIQRSYEQFFGRKKYDYFNPFGVHQIDLNKPFEVTCTNKTEISEF